jgi:uncharacterized protein (UPF0303 family)
MIACKYGIISSGEVTLKVNACNNLDALELGTVVKQMLKISQHPANIDTHGSGERSFHSVKEFQTYARLAYPDIPPP